MRGAEDAADRGAVDDRRPEVEDDGAPQVRQELVGEGQVERELARTQRRDRRRWRRMPSRSVRWDHPG